VNSLTKWARPAAVSARNTPKTSLPADPEATRKRLRRCKAFRNELLKDRGGDPTRAQIMLADNAAGLAVWLEEQLQAIMQGAEFKISELTASMNTLSKLLGTLGINRVPKDVTTIENYIENIARRANGSAPPKEITLEATNTTAPCTN